MYDLIICLPYKYVQIVREHYLRDDIECGSKVCKMCKHNDEKPLEENLTVNNTGFTDKHYILVDTNVVLHQVPTYLLLFGYRYIYIKLFKI